MGIFSIFKSGLQKTKTALVHGIQSIFSDTHVWDENDYRQLERTLVGADLGMTVTKRIMADVKDQYERGIIKTGDDILRVTQEQIAASLNRDGKPTIKENPNGPTVILFVGVNGSGKTTSIAKLAHYFQQQGKKVLLGAGDTFRAAGVIQLQVWGERLGCSVVGGKQGGDSAAVAFDAIKSGIAQGVDYVIIDTAGRQTTRADLMQELEKVKRIIAKAMPEAPHEVWLTVDSSIGSNALQQAREFGKLFPISGLILTKLDGTGKGGVIVAIHEELGYPVQFVGLGEQLEDFQEFDPNMFAEAMFASD